MKKCILFCLLIIVVGCDEVNRSEKNITNVIESNQSSEEIALRIEDSIYDNLNVESENIFTKDTNQSYSDKELKELIGNMFIVGFYGTDINTKSQIVKEIENYHLGGVILFDRHPSQRGKAKNIKNPKQLKALTQKLQAYSSYPLFIATDQEGGNVARLKKKTGFKKNYPSAKDISTKYKVKSIKKIYKEMGHTLSDMGINLNFAPSIDMEINPNNVVIVKLKRSYGKDPKRVVMFSKLFIDAMHENNVLTSLKHFPGHGSSEGDTHKGFVDITKRWQSIELEPYKALIKEDLVDTIMVAHVFNKNIDNVYPASLSYKTVSIKLREELGYEGVVVTDDLQMYAISKHYTLEETLKLSINAKVDLLLFGNQLDPKNIVSVKKLVETTLSLVKNGEIQIQTIIDANHRIDKLKEKLTYNYEKEL